MKNANHDLIHLRQPNVLPFSASWWCYLGNLGLELANKFDVSVETEDLFCFIKGGPCHMYSCDRQKVCCCTSTLATTPPTESGRSGQYCTG